MKKVSVIVPVYNSQEYIEKCVCSILNQTYKNIELILINDGSKDNSQKILEKLEKQCSIIKVINKENQGVAKTRNLGIEKATGEYIMFIDNDDYIEENYIEKYINEIGDNDILLGGYKRINIENKILFKKTLKDTEWSKFIIVAPWAKLFKRKFLISNKIEFLTTPIGEDVYFSLLLYSKNPKVKIFTYNGYYWFYNSKSVSNTSQKGLNENIDILRFLNQIKFLNIDDKYMNYYLYRYIVWYLLFSGRKSESNKFIKEFNKVSRWFDKEVGKLKISPFSVKLKGESLNNRLIVFIFSIISKLRLIKLFAKIYCKGKGI